MIEDLCQSCKNNHSPSSPNHPKSTTSQFWGPMCLTGLKHKHSVLLPLATPGHYPFPYISLAVDLGLGTPPQQPPISYFRHHIFCLILAFVPF